MAQWWDLLSGTGALTAWVQAQLNISFTSGFFLIFLASIVDKFKYYNLYFKY
jgi:hypothetical protein